ncbi:Hypothetical protein CINCED_3A018106 [Cinara cedri]|uniref:Uncharacterized protein n=1 Tax=Cinara cedri TaxID=506608 RepID=A0A5E4MS10_9HEMI|nr:Hypothetical protein CINCED_3A018106 [Cinara cedri]
MEYHIFEDNDNIGPSTLLIERTSRFNLRENIFFWTDVSEEDLRDPGVEDRRRDMVQECKGICCGVLMERKLKKLKRPKEEDCRILAILGELLCAHLMKVKLLVYTKTLFKRKNINLKKALVISVLHIPSSS